MIKTLLKLSTPFLLSSTLYAHDVGVWVNTISVFRSDPTYISSKHHAHLYNNTDQTQIYWVYFSISADGVAINTRPSPPFIEQEVLPPHTDKNIERTLNIYTSFPFPGTYNAKAISQVSGDGAEYHEYTGFVHVH